MPCLRRGIAAYVCGSWDVSAVPDAYRAPSAQSRGGVLPPACIRMSQVFSRPIGRIRLSQGYLYGVRLFLLILRYLGGACEALRRLGHRAFRVEQDQEGDGAGKQRRLSPAAF